ncbi:MAG: 16S rRNA (cytosine(1402)-N(4))-methyltransferase RsmH [Proteobacteria bacterium]|nr:16S rRNA (cytosine(1402)-N(4))-methyltransferase RsmH [Pseudomonadota bacterium]
MGYGHKPVLLNEVIEALNIRAEGYYIDGTFGRGGHSREILKRLGPKGRLLAFDKDPDAVMSAGIDFVQDERFEIIQGSFTMLMQQVKRHKAVAQVAGVLFDFGVSSPQLDDTERGFSFRFDAPLDMRMNPDEGQSVAAWLNTASETEIADVIYEYGEERASRRIAKSIINARAENPVTTTTQLAELVRKSAPSRKGPKKKNAKKINEIHPATKTFQALRIFINHELDEIKEVLPQAVDVLCPGGRLAAISFHSLEDRIVKRFMRNESMPKETLPELPIIPDYRDVKLKLIGKKRRATDQEIKDNPRARSATLRVAERN